MDGFSLRLLWVHLAFCGLLCLAVRAQLENLAFDAKLAIVNCPHHHVDVIAGAAYAFRDYIKNNQTHIYLNDFEQGTLDLLQSGLGIDLQKNGTLEQVVWDETRNTYSKNRPPKKDLLVFISPEYPPYECREVRAVAGACSSATDEQCGQGMRTAAVSWIPSHALMCAACGPHPRRWCLALGRFSDPWAISLQAW